MTLPDEPSRFLTDRISSSNYATSKLQLGRDMSTRPDTLLGEARSVLHIARGLRANSATAMLRFFELRGPRKFSANEIFNLALLDPKITRRDLKAYRSKEHAWPVYEPLHPQDDLLTLNDKSKFNEFCEARGLPILPCPMILSRADVCSLLDHIAAGRADAAATWVEKLPSQFVIKPSFGYQGQGVQFFLRQGQRIKILEGNQWLTLPDFLELLQRSLDAPKTGSNSSTTEQSLLVQETGFAHPNLAELSGSPILQSVRICTLLDDRDRGSVLFGFLKIRAGNNLIDNFQKGVTGNLLGYLDHENGTIFRAIGRDPKLQFNRVLSHHPDTGAALIGFEVPYWKDACNLALRAAALFRTTSAIGWDIGITPAGPVLIEGNGTWDPVAPLFRELPKITRRM